MKLGIKSTISNFYLFTKNRYCYTHIIFWKVNIKAGLQLIIQHNKFMYACVCILFTRMCMCVCMYIYVCVCLYIYIGFWSGSVVKNLPANAGDTVAIDSISGFGNSGGRNGNLFQYSCLENPMDRGVWWVIVHGVAESTTWLSNWTHTHARKDTCDSLDSDSV